MNDFPTYTDEKFQLALLKAIVDVGGTAVADELRPMIEEQLSIAVSPKQINRWKSIVSWTLIEVGPKNNKGRGKEWLECPFGTGDKQSTQERNAWINLHKSQYKPQQVWRILEKGREQLTRSLSGISETPSQLSIWSGGSSSNGAQKRDNIRELHGIIREALKNTLKDDSFNEREYNEARLYAIGLILQRRGQPEFRSKLLKLYKRCLVTGCDAEEALEAAHILPYSEGGTNRPSNGLLLRADIHTLFDLGLISINHDSEKVCVSSILMNTVYADLDKKPLFTAEDQDLIADKESLTTHFRLVFIP